MINRLLFVILAVSELAAVLIALAPAKAEAQNCAANVSPTSSGLGA